MDDSGFLYSIVIIGSAANAGQVSGARSRVFREEFLGKSQFQRDLGVWLAAGPVHGYDPNLAAQENCRKE